MSFTQSLVYSVAMKDGGGANTRFNWTESNTQAGLISVIKGSSDTTCNFHESFQAQMDRIEKHCANHKHA